LTVQIVSGEGKVVPDLNGQMLQLGKIYTVQARPASGQIFLGWTGVFPTNNPKVSFEMKEGLILQAAFMPNPFPDVAGTYTGVFLDPGTNRFRSENSGFVRMQVTKTGLFTGRATMPEGSYAFRGVFDPHLNADAAITRRGLPPVAFDLHLTNGSYVIGGTAITTTINSNLLNSSFFAEKNDNLASPVGKFHVVLQDTAPEPRESADMTASISKSGTVQLRGALSTGQRFSLSSALSKNRFIPFYLSLGKGTDVLAGWLAFNEDGPIANEGEIYAVHAGVSGVLFLQQAAP
jgi:hypothetical protein